MCATNFELIINQCCKYRYFVVKLFGCSCRCSGAMDGCAHAIDETAKSIVLPPRMNANTLPFYALNKNKAKLEQKQHTNWITTHDTNCYWRPLVVVADAEWQHVCNSRITEARIITTWHDLGVWLWWACATNQMNAAHAIAITPSKIKNTRTT